MELCQAGSQFFGQNMDQAAARGSFTGLRGHRTMCSASTGRQTSESKAKGRLEAVLDKLDPRYVLVDSRVYASLMKQYGNEKALLEGKQLHAYLIKCGHERDTFLGNHLMNMYGKCGSVEDACRVFETIRQRNVFSWNIMVAVYVQNGQLQRARCVFEGMPEKNVVSWNTMVAAYAQNGHLEEAKSMFDKMPDRNVVSWNSLVTAYAQNGHLEDAKGMFDNMPKRDVASWNAMIAAYAQSGHGKEALQLFRQLNKGELKPNDVTFISVLDACASPEALEDGKFIHACIARSKFRSDYKVENALLNMYGKCQSLQDARSIFDNMYHRDVVAWNGMIAVCAQCGCGEEGLQLFRLMDLEGQEPDLITFISTFDACSSLSSVECGKTVHASIQDSEFESSLIVATALLNMYAKCGSVELAQAVFERMKQQDLLSWTAIIAAHARNGHGEDALELFRLFGLEGIQPDAVAFLTILSACSHAGLLDDGRQFFVALNGDYKVAATMDHYHCMIDLLGRAGQLELAEQLIDSMPFEPDSVALVTLLAACKTHGDVQRGARVAKLASGVSPEISAPYVYLSNPAQFLKT